MVTVRAVTHLVATTRVVPPTPKAIMTAAATNYGTGVARVARLCAVRQMHRTATRSGSGDGGESQRRVGDRLMVERAAHGVAVVTLDRPQKLNALDIAMFRAIDDVAEELRQDRACCLLMPPFFAMPCPLYSPRDGAPYHPSPQRDPPSSSPG